MKSKLIRKYYLTILLIFILVQGLFGKDLPEGFVYINDFIPNAVIDLRYSTDHNFIGKPIDDYKSQKCIKSCNSIERSGKGIGRIWIWYKNF